MTGGARRLGRDDMIAGYYTISGSMAGAGRGEPARHSFVDRVAAAAEAGFVGIGLLADDYVAQRRAGSSDEEMLAVLGEHEMRVEEIEFLYHWAYDGDRGAFARRHETVLFHMADVFRPHHLSLGEVEPPDELPPFDVVVERFAGVCDRAADHGLTVAFEFLPWTGVPDAAACWDVVAAADRPNGAVILDVWHHFRGADDDDQIRAIPPDKIVALALSDAAADVVGDLVEDTTAHRLPPGMGAFDLERVIGVVAGLGCDIPVVAEILSRTQAALPVREAAKRAHEATGRVLAAAGW